MNDGRPGPPASVPTLTEVVDAAPEATPSAPVARMPSEQELARRVLEALEHEIGRVVEFRVREALTPVLERTADALVRDARGELARTLKDVVAKAVASEIRRQRGG